MASKIAAMLTMRKRERSLASFGPLLATRAMRSPSARELSTSHLVREPGKNGAVGDRHQGRARDEPDQEQVQAESHHAAGCRANRGRARPAIEEEDISDVMHRGRRFMQARGREYPGNWGKAG